MNVKVAREKESSGQSNSRRVKGAAGTGQAGSSARLGFAAGYGLGGTTMCRPTQGD